MRWWRRDGVDGLKAMASLGLLLGGVLTLAGCAASSANEAATYVSAAHTSAERTDRADDATPATAVASAEPSKPVGAGSVSGGRGRSLRFYRIYGAHRSMARAPSMRKH